MASSVLNQAIGTIHCFDSAGRSQDHPELVKVAFSSPFRGQKFQIIVLKQYNRRSAASVRASASHTPVFDPVSTPSKSTSSELRKKSSKKLPLKYNPCLSYLRTKKIYGE